MQQEPPAPTQSRVTFHDVGVSATPLMRVWSRNGGAPAGRVVVGRALSLGIG